MPTYLYWGDDDFALVQGVKDLKAKVIEEEWLEFNFEKIAGNHQDGIITALAQAMTPPFGWGGRLVWLTDATITHSCSEALLKQLERTLPAISDDCHLLITSSKKPDQRLKSTKLLNKYAEIKEFALIPPWQPEQILAQLKGIARELGLDITPDGFNFLLDAVGNQTRLMWSELEKVALFHQTNPGRIDRHLLAQLIHGTSQNTLELASQLIHGQISAALHLLGELLNQNEPALRIVATLVGQFRTWAIVKLMTEQGHDDIKAIASLAELKNPKRVYFLKKEVARVRGSQLLQALPILLELENSLKSGDHPQETMEIAIIKLGQLFR